MDARHLPHSHSSGDEPSSTGGRTVERTSEMASQREKAISLWTRRPLSPTAQIATLFSSVSSTR
eukprot:scaffold2529_cov363-Prasinococcus_capsulatus_cf.AAC.4